MSKPETRRFELRADPDSRTLRGVAVTYGDTAKLPWGSERIEPGAFAGNMGDVVLNTMHERGRPLARTGGAGLELADSAERLAFTADLPNTREADDVIELVRRGVMRGASVEMRVTDERIEAGVRVIERASLHAVAVVDTPAYPASEVQARMAAAPKPAPRRRWYF